MGQISFKVPEDEMEFLRWWAEKQAQPVSVIYRNATRDNFHEWKIETLIQEYQQGKIGFKRFCNLSGLSFHQASLLFEEKQIEPPISEIMDLYTNKISESISPAEIFKNGKIPKRESSSSHDLGDA